MNAVILVGGEGTRLRPLTLNLPKPAVPLVNKPFLAYQLELLRKHGVDNITFAVGYKPDKIRECFGDGSKWGVRLSYAVEHNPLGTGGAIKNTEKFLKGTTIIFNGDVLTDLNLSAVVKAHREKKAAATIVLTEVEDPTSYGVVETEQDHRIKRFLEKPSWAEVKSRWINAGTYIFEEEIVSLIPKNTVYSLERELFPLLLKLKKSFYAFPSRSYWVDIGTPERYLQTHLDILEQRVKVSLPVGAIKKRGGISIGKKTVIGKNVITVGPLIVGESCDLETEASLERCVLGDNCKVGKRASLEEVVLWNNVQVGEGAVLKGCIVGKDCRIGAHVTVRQGAVLGDGMHIPPYSKL